MYNYLNGLITEVTPDYIVVDIQGVGYQVQVANPYAYQTGLKDHVKVYIYQAVREDSITLFGFQTSADKNLFLQLISVSGIGPKSALAILATPDHQALIEAIQQGDDKYLAKFPGIGKKTAGRIIVELRDRLTIADQPTNSIAAMPISDDPALTDAMAALIALGYTEKQVAKVEKTLQKEAAGSTNDYISRGLKLLN
ncbi:Holliday junction branch migration protein RuvA [Limosilactobacillus gastricus]|uniref:Holliday junction branch migration complex subunit RuvA n=1 Tax=Limosilactobacillus gastricus DSM 16045 TaxID=1423749 RepID=A0A0R1VKU9_9LACO|nr:Holliday junction branch migration protein RuvA [Limosilactobacillus gastricus]KRM03478.1 Holliday junction ATP-dependent DNA helicase ruvA [Limosilactobacillus gastricus DSM 16045]QGF40813.1 Holliday junction branch migration protein RuvA [Limosilactobacillus gastricus]